VPFGYGRDPCSFDKPNWISRLFYNQPIPCAGSRDRRVLQEINAAGPREFGTICPPARSESKDWMLGWKAWKGIKTAQMEPLSATGLKVFDQTRLGQIEKVKH